MHCGVLAVQAWNQARLRSPNGGSYVIDCWRCDCHNCGEHSYWREDDLASRLIDPVIGGGPRPHVDMPEAVREDYEEARTIVMQSPRGASALLRLAVQKLCAELGEPGKNINDDIASLVDKGLSVEVQQALDSLRVIGNNARSSWRDGSHRRPGDRFCAVRAAQLHRRGPSLSTEEARRVIATRFRHSPRQSVVKVGCVSRRGHPCPSGCQYGGRSSYHSPSVLKARQKRCLAFSSSSESSMSGV